MDDELTSTDVSLVLEKVSRRGLFKFAAKVGAGLVAFVPAAGVLLQNVPVAHADGPNYTPCSTVTCGAAPSSGPGSQCVACACFDGRNPTYFCYCCG